ncbi:DUF2157 domain-containing protein [Candidatus Parcubacteria bacterium]|nr:MAG: DUF2157 domain-containing protein [Candidatus Parcubacteria bacterium]
MNREQALAEIRSWISQGIISEADLSRTIAAAPAPERAGWIRHRFTIAEVLYALGGVLVLSGIGVLIAQQWQNLPTIARILVTFGSAVAAYGVGIALLSHPALGKLGQVFAALSGILMPIGVATILYEMDLDIGALNTQVLLASVCLLIFGVSSVVFRRTVFYVFTLLFGTWFYFATALWLVEGNPMFQTGRFIQYLILIAGAAYLALGYYFDLRSMEYAARRLYAIGTLGFLGAAFALGGWFPDQNAFWEFIFPFLAVGFIFLSVPTRSGAFLTLGSLFLMGYIGKITAEYFADTFGWELSLVVAGLLVMATGYVSLRLRRKYLRPGEAA